MPNYTAAELWADDLWCRRFDPTLKNPAVMPEERREEWRDFSETHKDKLCKEVSIALDEEYDPEAVREAIDEWYDEE